MKLRVYIAGPYTKGDVAVNVRSAILAAERVVQLGHTPFCPHLTHFWHLITPHDYEFWLEYALEWLQVCDCLIRLPGESSGADKEVAWAVDNGMRVFYSLGDFERWLKEREPPCRKNTNSTA